MAISKIKSNSIADDAITSDKVADGTLVASDLLDNTITGVKLATDIAISTSGNITTTGDLTGTLATASQPNITSVGTLTSFTSTGIDDNATANALTLDSSGNLQFNSGYGSVETAYGCRAWINFDGTGTPSIRGSGNVSSITDNTSGNYTINLTTALTDGNFSIVASASGRGALTTPDTDVSVGVGPPTTSLSASAFRIQIGDPNVQVDDVFVTAAVFR